MTKIVPYLLGASTALIAVVVVPSAAAQVDAWRGVTSYENVLKGTPASSVNRAAKSDRHRLVRLEHSGATVTTVEVVGVRDAAIVYRDRDGRELFRTDPVSNVTVVTKGLQLPEVTVREKSGSAVKPVPVRTLNEQTQERKPPSRPRKPPLGCEPSFSPVAAPHLGHHTGRCMAWLVTPREQFTG